MAKTTATFDIVEAFTIEFEGKLYFRVELLKRCKEAAIDVIEYSAEVYQLRWPNGFATMEVDGDKRFRQSWLYLDDFPTAKAPNIAALRELVLTQLSDYADRYFEVYPKTSVRRVG